MRSRSYRRLWLLGGWTLLAWAFIACTSHSASHEISSPLLLDQLCRDPNPDCILEGSARVTTGITEDTIAVRLGPEPGSLSVRWSALGLSDDPGGASRLALARGKGRLTSDPTSCELGEEFGWCELSGAAASGAAGSAMLVAQVTSGNTIDVIDLRESRSDGCAVAQVGRR